MTGSLVGGNIAEEIMPVSVADFFVIDAKSWLKYQTDQAEGIATKKNSDLFKESRSSMILGDYKKSIDAAWKIKQVPEGGFEYTADLAFSFLTSKGGENIVKRRNIRRSLRQELPKRRREAEEVNESRNMTANDYFDSAFNNSNRSSAEKCVQSRRKLYGQETTHERESMMNCLKEDLKAKSLPDSALRSYELSDTMAIHELSFLDTIKGTATTQHIVQKHDKVVHIMVICLHPVCCCSVSIPSSDLIQDLFSPANTVMLTCPPTALMLIRCSAVAVIATLSLHHTYYVAFSNITHDTIT